MKLSLDPWMNVADLQISEVPQNKSNPDDSLNLIPVSDKNNYQDIQSHHTRCVNIALTDGFDQSIGHI